VIANSPFAVNGEGVFIEDKLLRSIHPCCIRRGWRLSEGIENKKRRNLTCAALLKALFRSYLFKVQPSR
jgi:hypothetical protein